jgi:hypothetical protein
MPVLANGGRDLIRRLKCLDMCSPQIFPRTCVVLTVILLTSTKWWAHASASKWRTGFNSAFKGLMQVTTGKELCKCEV